MTQPPHRDISADILKFLAVFIIINSHSDALYPESLRALATGGAIGDCLFLFVSGLTLSFSAGRITGFGPWYKRRINRIYPAVIVCALVSCLINLSPQVGVLQLFGGEFIIAIMIYYAGLYAVMRRCPGRLWLIAGIISAVTVAVYLLWFPGKDRTGEEGIYGITTLFRWLPYSLFMLMGLGVGLRRRSLRLPGGWVSGAGLLLSVVAFYGIQLAGRIDVSLAPWQILSVLPLAGVIWFMYCFCALPFWQRVYGRRGCHAVIMAVSGVCLESYLIQLHLISDRMNYVCGFPVSLLLTVALILVVSYLCRCGARLFSQTFAPGPYDWPAVFRI